MPLRLKTKLTLSTALLVLAVAVLISVLHIAGLARQTIAHAQERAEFVSQQVFFHAQNALNDAAAAGLGPESSEPEAIREYVRTALDQSPGLTSMIDASLGYSATIYEVTITDHNGVALVSSDASMPGRVPEKREPLALLADANFWQQMRLLYGPPRILERRLPFDLGGQPFGEIRISLNTVFLRREIDPTLRAAALYISAALLFFTVLAAITSHVSLAPIAKISDQLDRISKGEAVPAAVSTTDEFGQVSNKISQIGQQLRGAQEIFSALKENVNHMMAGLDDGLILFTAEGRAVMVSPAVQKFLGVAPEALMGKTAAQIFPGGHPLRNALHVGQGPWRSLGPTEVRLNGAGGTGAASRATVSVQAVPGAGGEASIGALVTLRDVESIERLGSQIQISERLAALTRVTAGVAHEVKNPLNSMSIWLENLKQNLPAGEASPVAQQAVQILGSEIHRLDRVVKTFLDFSGAVELDLKELDANEILREVAALAKPQFVKAGVRLDVTGALEPLHVMADRALLQQAVLNLTLNALEAVGRVAARTEPGRVILACARHNSAVTIRVEDNGAGIAPDDRKKIFQLYFTTRPGGSGIGLAMAFRTVQLHNGSMDFDSEVGRGSTFRIELPLSDA